MIRKHLLKLIKGYSKGNQILHTTEANGRLKREMIDLSLLFIIIIIPATFKKCAELLNYQKIIKIIKIITAKRNS